MPTIQVADKATLDTVNLKIGASGDTNANTLFGKLSEEKGLSKEDLKTNLNSTIGTVGFKPIDQMIDNIPNALLDPKKIQVAILHNSTFTIPRGGVYKIIACGLHADRYGGGGGCAIDQRQYQKNDKLIIKIARVDRYQPTTTVTCSTAGTNLIANSASETRIGATATGGNIANYQGGSANPGEENSLGCGANATNSTGNGTGGIIGGDGGSYGGKGGDGGYIGGNGGACNDGGYGGYIGGNGGWYSGSSRAGNGGDGGYIGGKGGDGYENTTTSSKSVRGGHGGSGGYISGEPYHGDIYHGGKGGIATPLYNFIPFYNVINYEHRNGIVFIEEI